MKIRTKLDEWKNWLWEIFEDNITFDSIRDLPETQMHFLGALTYVGYIACFIGFTVSGYDLAVNALYLAPDSGDTGVSRAPFYTDLLYHPYYNS